MAIQNIYCDMGQKWTQFKMAYRAALLQISQRHPAPRLSPPLPPPPCRPVPRILRSVPFRRQLSPARPTRHRRRRRSRRARCCRVSEFISQVLRVRNQGPNSKEKFLAL